MANIQDTEALFRRKSALDYSLTHQELAGTYPANDTKGLISDIADEGFINFVKQKKAAPRTPGLDALLQVNSQPGISLTEEDKKKLLAFLNTLNDKKFVSDPLFSPQ